MSRQFRLMQRYRVQVNEEDKESSWVSYTDLMSALLIIFVLVLMVTLFVMDQNYQESIAALNEKQTEIEKRDKTIQNIVGVKREIIDLLLKEFNGELKIDKQTGAITFPGGVFFETNKSDISPEGKAYLEKFIPKYTSVLLSKEYEGNIAQILVEGHTDNEGGYLYNLKLSQDRALSVVEAIYSPDFSNFKQKESLKRIITANGRSFNDLIKTNGKVDQNKSRRVVFKFRLKEEAMLEKIQTMVKLDE
jgi:outer membrane protein OmpA-like peptidoglycan-associated protein